ncbi:hypothetical protein Bache_2478 [Bacteroides helcogenes P 36-108]|uniref:Uncharacterized protein n=1 Tax=Bacteroides helcogenes (strain ATCC 35417 / DSM 20613 / JCM 6297 / CCUG 15421 / P 36-108) TaxID=693979 RepID=E6SUU8_BACT6|nr:hypothetical protein Bache_2478 [Bacteroides helcogenes P 36-108]
MNRIFIRSFTLRIDYGKQCIKILLLMIRMMDTY